MSSIEQTLQDRGKLYGEYEGHADITQALKVTMRCTPRWTDLAPHQRETLEMIAHKIGRILNGDPNYHDSWHDIVGYAKLSADALLKEPEKTKATPKSLKQQAAFLDAMKEAHELRETR